MHRPFPAYKGNDPYIFICYSHADAEQVYAELSWLHDQGINIWYDEGIKPGEEWTNELAQAIEDASHFVFFATPASIASRYCRNEIHFALDLDKPHISLHLQETNLTGGLRLSLGSSQAILTYQQAAATYRQKLLSFLESEKNVASSNESIPPKPQSQQIAHSIAVLPFVNMSADPANEYFSEGISEEILNLLVKTNSMPVIARTSSFQFKGQNLNVKSIGDQLNVTHILEGSVRKADDTVRITGQLVEAATGIHLWSDRYDRQLHDIFSLQDEIALNIVTEIEKKLGVNAGLKTAPSIDDHSTTNVEAYDLFLRAETNQKQLNPISIKEAIGQYQQALKLDPKFVDAWVGLTYSYLWQCYPIVAGEFPSVGYPLVRQTAKKVLELDPGNAKALFAVGYTVALGDHRWTEGFAQMEAAIEMSSQDAVMISLYGSILDATHQPNAGEVLERAYRLDPLSIAALMLACHLWFKVSQDDAMRIMAPLLVSEKNNFFINIWIGFVELVLGRFDSAEKNINKAREFVASDNTVVRAIDLFWAQMHGDIETADAIGRELVSRSKTEMIPFLFAPWRNEDVVEIYRTIVQWNDYWILRYLMIPKPDEFPDEDWVEFNRSMNTSELTIDQDQTLWHPRSEASVQQLLDREIQLDQSVIDRLCGYYLGLVNLTFKWQNEQFILESSQMAGQLIAVSENRFEMRDDEAWIEFIFDDQNRPIQALFHQDQTELRFHREEE